MISIWGIYTTEFEKKTPESVYKVYVLPSICVDLHAWPNPKVLFLHIKARSFINISIWCLALGNVYLLFEKKVNVQLNCVSMGDKIEKKRTESI